MQISQIKINQYKNNMKRKKKALLLNKYEIEIFQDKN